MSEDLIVRLWDSSSGDWHPSNLSYFLGGIASEVGGETLHTFRSSGDLILVGPGPVDCEVLVVGGGGGAGGTGTNSASGGGGGGQVLHDDSLSIGATQAITVGGGGAGGASGVQGSPGGTSSIGSLASAVGGGGGARGSSAGNGPGGDGASGGGGGGCSTGSAGGGVGSAGFDGGTGVITGTANWRVGGGGGGAGEVGQAGGLTLQHPGDGGDGVAYDTSGASTYYGGGGGGGSYNNGGIDTGIGGLGGGANGKNGGGTGNAGTANTGGGGGGQGQSSVGGAGGSGIVLVRYPTPTLDLSYREQVVNAFSGIAGVALAAYWPMDGLPGELEDQISTADLTDPVSLASVDAPTGVPGGSRDLLANGRMTAALALSAEMILGCWFKSDVANLTGDMCMMSRWAANNGLILSLNSNEKLVGFFGGLNVTGATTVDTGWHLALFSSGLGEGRRVWLDGVVDGLNASGSGHGTTGSAAWEIGAYSNDTSSTRWDGHLAHCFVATGELDATQGNALCAALLAV